MDSLKGRYSTITSLREWVMRARVDTRNPVSAIRKLDGCKVPRNEGAALVIVIEP